jgi:PAS domain S-box-containing protein
VLIGFVILGSVAAMTLVGLAGVVVRRDLQKRQQAEEERDRFFNLSRDLLCIASFDGFFKRLSPVWEQTLGFSLDELMAEPFLHFVHPEDRPRTLVEAGKLTAGGEVVFFENRYRRKDGTWRWFSWSARSSVAAKMIYAIARDITEQKEAALQIVQLNAELVQRAAQLEAANKELEAFSYSVSHDLRAPLRHIGGFVDLLGKQSASALDATAQRYLGFIASAVKQMGRLVDDLLSFSRMARSEMRHTDVNLERLVVDIRTGMRADLQGRTIEWTIGSLPEIQADLSMLRIAMTNLISNAVKYTRPRDRAEIEIGSLPNPAEYILFIRDNGVGFDMQYSAKLFGVFQRLHGEDEFEGTGIGLANVRRILLRHGGRVWAEAREGVGATFYISLPKTPTANATFS